MGQVKRAIKLHEEDLAIAREIGEHRSEGVSLDKLGVAYCGLGQFEHLMCNSFL